MVLKPSLGNSERPSCFCSWGSVQTLPKAFTRDKIFVVSQYLPGEVSPAKGGVGAPAPSPAAPTTHPPPLPLAPRALRTSRMTDKGYQVPALCAAELL